MHKIAILISLTSKRQNLQTVQDIWFFHSSLPSFFDTVHKDSKWLPKNRFYFYFGYDKYDSFYDNLQNVTAFIYKFRSLVQDRGYSESFFLAKMMCFSGTSSSPTHVWNRLFEKSYAEGCDYFFQVGDDINYKTLDWDRDFIFTLTHNKYGRNIGVCGPLDLGYPKLITQSFVSRIHMEIFGTMFPWVFKNCYMDNWISKVYGAVWTFLLKEHQIYNEFWVPRYQRYMKSREYLEDEILLWRKNIDMYCKSHNITIETMKYRHPMKLILWMWLEIGDKSYVVCFWSTLLRQVTNFVLRSFKLLLKYIT